MLRLVGLLLVAGALAAGAAYLPIGGRTVRDRWHASRGPGDFARRSFRELSQAAGLLDPPARPVPPKSAPSPRTPVERHTDSDRAALERVVAERGAK